MNCKSLMIGDWVILNYEGVKKIVRIIRLHQHYADVMTENDIEIQSVAYSMIEEIPLTEEILSANGFKHQLSINNIDHGWNLGDLWLTKDLELFVYKVHIKLSYVHELQNVLRLCGLKDLADNFKIKAKEK